MEHAKPTGQDSLKRALIALEKMKAKLKQVAYAKKEPIAIVGMGCRFPGGADDPHRYWALLDQGQDVIREAPLDRWNNASYFDPDPQAKGKISTRNGGFLADPKQFEPEFFGISPREAASMDPQHRLLLEVTWEALEDAGLAPDRLMGSQTGVFMGIAGIDGMLHIYREHDKIDAYAATGNVHSVASGRLSYVLGLRGPCLSVDTACSSSLVSLHLACQSLRSRECDAALAGGVNRIHTPEISISFSKGNMLSPDGRCKTFDDSADGFTRGEGCGVVVLKRLSDALKEGLHIQAVISGSAINHDGRTSGLTVPCGPAQQDVLRTALDNAGLSPDDIDYIEAHGTGTALGDPIEVGALAAIFGKREKPLHLGSVKANIGHLEAAAGIASLIKVVLSLQGEKIPANPLLKTPTQKVDWSHLPFELLQRPAHWPKTEKPRAAGLSSFGFSGTNAHVIVSEAPAHQIPPGDAVESYLFTLSARTDTALREWARRHAELLEGEDTPTIGDTCFTANSGRALMRHRLAITAPNTQNLAAALRGLAAGRPSETAWMGKAGQPPRTAFLFTGQGSQYWGMGRQLYQLYPIFRETLDLCGQYAEPLLEKPLLSVMFGSAELAALLNQTIYTQPALFALEVALARLWRSWGLQPTSLIGHSVGEFAAACFAGIFSLADGLKLIAARGRLMQALPCEGGMVSVEAPADQVAVLLKTHGPNLSIAALNSPNHTVISGVLSELNAVRAAFVAKGVSCRDLNVSHAFHSALMKPILADFEKVAAQVSYSEPTLELFSNVTGKPAATEMASASYWVEQVCAPVRFAEAAAALAEAGCTTFLEIGPKPVLLAMGRHCVPSKKAQWLASMRPPQSEAATLQTSLAQLFIAGAKLDLAAADPAAHGCQPVSLPTYPFERQTHWATRQRSEPGRASTPYASHTQVHPLLDGRLRLPALKETIFEASLSLGERPFLDEHRIFDRIVVSGASHLSAVLGAATSALGTTSLVLEDIVFPSACVLGEDEKRLLQVVLTPEAAGSFSFQLLTLGEANEEAKIHARGMVKQASPVGASLDFTALRQNCPEPLDAAQLYAAQEARHIELGPNYRWIGEMYRGDRQGFCRLQAPSGLDSWQSYLLHPGLIDSCFGLLLSVIGMEKQQTFIPFYFENVAFYKVPKGTKLWASASLREDANELERFCGDVDLHDEDGERIASFLGLEGRVASPALLLGTAAKVNPWLYQPGWEALPNPATAQPKTRLLVFADRGGLGKQLAAQHQDSGGTSVIVDTGFAFEQRQPNHFKINPLSSEDYLTVLNALPKDDFPLNVVHLWAADCTAETPPEEAEPLGCASVLLLLQALKNASLPKLRLTVITQGAQAVEGSPTPLVPAQTALWGLLRTAALELAELELRFIDIDASPSSLANVAQWLYAIGPETQIAIRKGSAQGARLVKMKPQGNDAPKLDPQASYLVTGGLGGLGLRVAEWLVKRGARHLALAGRSAPSKRSEETLTRLRESGADLRVFRADLSQESEAFQLLSGIGEALPPLKGIVHAAGVVDDGVLLQLTPERLRKVMAPKAYGAWHLHRASQNLNLDFFSFFSSGGALLGSQGQANYAAANAFLDGLAHYRHLLGLPGLSVNWGPWLGSGMFDSLSEPEQARYRARGIRFLTPEQGVEAQALLLGSGTAQAAVLPMDWNAYLERAQSAPAMLSKQAASFAPSPQQASGTDAFEDVKRRLAEASEAERHTLLVKYLKDRAVAVLRLDASLPLDLEQPLNEMGLDSLMGIELKNRISRDLEVSLAMVSFIEGSGIRGLAALIAQDFGKGPEAQSQPDALPQVVPDPEKRGEPFPMSDIQQAYWVGRSASESENTAAHFYFELEGNGLDPQRLESAWQRLVTYHDMLRAVVLPSGEQQVLQNTPPYTLDVLDLRDLDVDTAHQRMERERERMSHQVHAADQWPLWEVKLSRFDGNRHRLHFSIDLLMADLSSFLRIFTTWQELYLEPDHPLPELELTFRDYVLAEKKLAKTAWGKASERYWFDRLASLPPAPQLSLAQNPETMTERHFERRECLLAQDRWALLKERAREFGVTPSGVLLAAFSEILAVWSKNAKFSLNLTLFNRFPLHPQVNEIVGDFTSVTLLEVDCSKEGTFADRAQMLKKQLWRDLDHRCVSGVKVIREMMKRGEVNQASVMPVVFTSALALGEEHGVSYDMDVFGKMVHGISQTPQVWLDHQVVEQDGALKLN